jgi:hypothetical protein
MTDVTGFSISPHHFYSSEIFFWWVSQEHLSHLSFRGQKPTSVAVSLRPTMVLVVLLRPRL